MSWGAQSAAIARVPELELLTEPDPKVLRLDRIDPGVSHTVVGIALIKATDFPTFVKRVLDEGLQLPIIPADAARKIKRGECWRIAHEDVYRDPQIVPSRALVENGSLDEAIETAGLKVVAGRQITLDLRSHGQLRTDIGHGIGWGTFCENRSGDGVRIAELSRRLCVDVRARQGQRQMLHGQPVQLTLDALGFGVADVQDRGNTV